ncbi:MAG: alpha-2-macroglobulin family protein [Devosia nanyangense]|uniref:Alpha-2-macroglobulin family protein n=1 Tax=Devosia nanyangense TaxID=1228055 RepID=A0A933L123_9HYPH|nr:alpha-2-macroglobulin family protein [Devosia nanyangense]
MVRLVRSALWLCAAMVLMFGVQAAGAAERSMSLLPGTDLPGFDYSVLKNSSLEACQKACTDEGICRALTFNEKTHWCFLKGDAGPETPFKGATSGKVTMSPTAEEIDAARQAELPFPASDLIYSAKSYATDLATTVPPPPGAVYADLVAAGDEDVTKANAAGAMIAYQQALGINHNDPALWLKLANVALERADTEIARSDDNNSYAFISVGTPAALNAFLLSESVAERATALAALGHALELKQMWRETIATYRASLALIDDAKLQARLDTAVAQHGFRVVSNTVDAEAATPRICAVFSDPLPSGSTDLSGYVVVEGAPQVAVETQDTQICVTGVDYGKRYHLTLRAGLPSADGESLKKDVELDAYVPDRAPFVGFANNAYVLPAGLGGGLPITSVNAKSADVVIYRIGDRSIATAIRNGIFQSSLDGYRAEDIANQYGEEIYEGTVELAEGEPNANAITAIPVTEALGDMPPGAYVITAKVTDSKQEFWADMATQWFIVTDLGLTTVSGDDGVHAFVRSLSSAQPVTGAHVRLVAINNEILGEADTDASGRADFAPGLARGEGGRAPQVLVAETAGGDYAVLDVSKPAFDLTDRGVDGRPSPGPLDVFATTERGVYRPGETVFLTALLRDAHAKAVANLPLTMEVERPDGVVATHQVLDDKGAGGYFAAIPLVAEAMRGSWAIRLYADPKAEALDTLSFLVEDFEPERLAFEISAPDGPFKTEEPNPITVMAKYLYGATAPGLAIEADAVLRPVTALKAYPGYIFGRLDDSIETDREPLGVVGTTDEAGNATAEVSLPEPQATTRPLEAQIVLRLVDTNGRTVERSITRPVLADANRIGVKPKFDETAGLTQGSEADFDVIAVAPSGEAVAETGLSWSLSRIETTYQWYRASDRWKWEAITTTRQVANGVVDTPAGGPATVGAIVDWGRYRLEVTSTGPEPTSTTYEFYAGYYYPVAGSDTPDTLSVALDKPSYHTGETAHLKLDPQFAGTALVMVVDDRIIEMKAVDVPEGGTTVDLAVTDDWGPGAYVTATLYRPASATEKRMPARALGLAFADVDPGNAKLDVGLEVPEVSLPRHPFTAKVKLANAVAGEKAYVAVAAVDLGILNLTKFPIPDPDGWFFGQRQLGVEFRDLYGQLIDPTQGLPGALRSGGDGSGGRLGTPPATTVLVALHSGIVDVGADGTATVTFDMPDFAGTVRVMAMAWTANAVGHAWTDAIVRDPVVVTLSPPRFLRLGDTSRLLVEINNVSGAAGTYKVSLTTGDGISTDAPESSVDLAVGARTALNLGLTGTGIGDNDLRVTITDPTGNALVKDLTLGVRATSAPRTVSELIPIEPGATIVLDKTRFADMVPHTGALTLAIGSIARLDVPRLLLDLDRYPYGCVEQISSRAFPLLYLNEVAQMIGMGNDAALDQRIKDAIADILSKQSSSGGFGLWGPFDTTDLWLDSYVTEFLIRAKGEGYDVPAEAMTRALDNLGNQVSYATDFDHGGEDIAYALYDLARAGRAAIGDLRYYLEARLSAFGSPLAQAQLGSALALYGDRTRAATAFEAAVTGLMGAEDRRRYRSDYGSQLRDTAAVLALAAEFTPSGVDIPALAARLARLRDQAKWTSTQEDAWTLVAAAALARSTDNGTVTVDGTPLTGTVYQRFDQEHFDDASVTIANTSNQRTEAKVSVTAIPATPPKASSNGFTIRRDYYLPDGTPADLASISQNDRFVVVLSLGATTLGSGQYVVADPLPAGFEIENPDLSSTAGVADLSWLSVDTPSHVESRTDQYVAAFRYVSDTLNFSTAYMVRATAPGTFTLPGATIEDMYRPELRANTDAGTIEVKATGGPADESPATPEDSADAAAP